VILIASLLLLGIVVARCGGRLTPSVLTMTTLVPIAIGHATLDRTLPGAQTASAYLLSLVAMVLGYVVRRPSHVQERIASQTTQHEIPDATKRALITATIVIAGLTIYHFSRIGLPILSPTVEADRFNFTGSGLFGLPGRAYLFGVPILAAGGVYAMRQWPSMQGRIGIFVTAVGLLVLSRLASGFKSGLLEVVTILFFATATTGLGLSIGDALRRYLLVAALGLVFAVQVSHSYATLAGLSQTGAIQALIQRSTGQGALPGRIVMQPNPPLPIRPSNAIVNDFWYFGARYTGISSSRFSFSQIVAAAEFGAPLSSGGTLPPVTVGAFPQLYYDYGVTAYPLFFLLGYCYNRVERAAMAAPTLLQYLTAITIIFILHEYVTKGNLVYLILNWGPMLAFVSVTLLIAGRRSRVEPEPVVHKAMPATTHSEER
jgi:hypothetical protein